MQSLMTCRHVKRALDKDLLGLLHILCTRLSGQGFVDFRTTGFKHALDIFLPDFQMKLQAQHVRGPGKQLVSASWRIYMIYGSGWQIEGISMPVKYGSLGCK